MVGIVSYGTYIPTYRIRLADIASAWKKDVRDIVGSLGIHEKSVPATDEDAVTIALEAAGNAIGRSNIGPSAIEALFVGSESHPYAVNPTSTIVGELLGIGNNYLAVDMEFACKAGTVGIQAMAGLLEAKQIQYGLVIGSDTAQSKPHDALEYTSASGGVAVVMGSDTYARPGLTSGSSGRISTDRKRPSAIIADLLAYTSYSSDTPDFWRRDGIRYPSHAGRFTGEPAYFTHVMGSAARLLDKSRMKPSDFDWCVFHMPNGKFPRVVAKRLGFTEAQLAPSLVVDDIGNPYCASTMLGLAAILDVVKPKQKIFMVSYGSGAGSDAFIWETTAELSKHQASSVKYQRSVKQQIEKKIYIDYVQYLKQTHKI